MIKRYFNFEYVQGFSWKLTDYSVHTRYRGDEEYTSSFAEVNSVEIKDERLGHEIRQRGGMDNYVTEYDVQAMKADAEHNSTNKR